MLCLQEREQQVGSLQAQLSEFRQPVLAMAGVSTAPVTSSESDTVTLAQPSRMSALSNASWTSDWNAAVLKNGNSSVAEMQLLTDEAFVVQPATTATPRHATAKFHLLVGRPLSIVHDNGVMLLSCLLHQQERQRHSWTQRCDAHCLAL